MSRALRILLVVALTAAVLLPGVGTAQAVTVPTTLSSLRAAEVGPVTPGFPIDAVGVTWDEAPGHTDEHEDDHAEEFGAVRFRSAGTWGPWLPFGEDGAQAEGSFGTSLVAGADADAYQVRGVPAHAQVIALNTTDGPPREVRQRPTGAADAMANCWSRYDWMADESKLPTTARSYAPAQVLAVHHTGESAHASGDPAAWVRSIYEYHLSRGWDDIGYQYLVGPGGELFEGRRSDGDSEACQTDHDGDGVLGDGSDFAHDGLNQVVTGAHTGGYNTGNAGVSVLGDYRRTSPTTAARQAVVDVLSHLAGRHGLTVANDDTGKVVYDNGVNSKTVYSIAMHKDFTNTECPGGRIERDLPSIRDDVAATLTGTTPSDPGDGDTVAPTRSVHAGLGLSTTGGKLSTNHLVADVRVDDVAPEPDVAVAGVAVTVAVTADNGFSSRGTATTSTDGTVQFSWKNVKPGTYTVTVVDVADPDWDGQQTSAVLTK